MMTVRCCAEMIKSLSSYSTQQCWINASDLFDAFFKASFYYFFLSVLITEQTIRQKKSFAPARLDDGMQHLVHPAGSLGGLMSICLSVPAVQVGGYSAQQV